MNRGIGLLMAVGLGVGTVVVPHAGSAPPAAAAGAATVSADAIELGRAIASDTSWVVGAEFVVRPPGSSTAIVTGGAAGFPTSGLRGALLSTGDADDLLLANTSGSSGTDLGGSHTRGGVAFDVTVLRIDLEIPQNVNCLAGIDFRFLSEEYPEWVSSEFNDAFVAELDRSTWTIDGSEVVAPDNFAFDPTGGVITMNAAGLTSMTAAQAAGTTFDGATPLTAAVPITPGPHSLYLSIFDLGDAALDSAVVVDNLRLGRVANVAQDCRSGAVLVDAGQYVALGDVAGRGGVAGDASAVVLNVTVAGARGPGFVTVFPCGAAQPTASNLNFVAGSTVPNAVTSKVGAGGKVCLFSSGATDLVVDVNGWFPA